MLDILRKFKFVIIALIFIFIALFLVSRSSGGNPVPLLYEKGVIFITAPMQHLSRFVLKGFQNLFDKYVFIIGLQEENNLLRKENITIRGENFRLREIEEENIRIRALIDFAKKRTDLVLLPAEVIAGDSKSNYKTLRINRGTADGVSEKKPVVAPQGIVGHVLRAYRHYSDILVITDRFSNVDAIVQRSRARGVLEGNIEKCRLKYVLREDDIKIGDNIISSGQDMLFPKGLPLGTVASIKKEKFGTTQDVEITSSVDFPKLEEVMVVLKNDIQYDNDSKSTPGEKE